MAADKKGCAVLLMTHGAQGESLLQTAAHMLGEYPPQVAAVNLQGGERRVDIERRAREAAAKLLDGAEALLVLSDLFGSTQAVIAQKVAAENKTIACVHGVNLAMVLEAVAMRNLPLAQLKKQVAAAGRRAVVVAR